MVVHEWLSAFWIVVDVWFLDNIFILSNEIVDHIQGAEKCQSESDM